jgi:hypothetical protein
MKLKKYQIKKDKKNLSQPGLTSQTRDPGNEIEINL